MSSSTVACSVFFSAPSTYQRPAMATGGNSPGRAALAATAWEIGTWSQPGCPKGAASPLSRSVATSTSLRFSVAEIIAASRRAEHAAHLRFQLGVAEQAGGQRAAEDLEG